MGYYFKLGQKHIDLGYDRSYPSPEEQLLWRLDELTYKKEELIKKGASHHGWGRLTDDDVRFAIPEYFDCTADVERAIELALYDLKNDHDFDILEIERAEREGFDLDQLTLFEVIKFPAEPASIKAA